VSLGGTISVYRTSLAVARRIRALPGAIPSEEALAFNQRERSDHETQERVADWGDDRYGIGVYRVRSEDEVERFLTAAG